MPGSLQLEVKLSERTVGILCYTLTLYLRHDCIAFCNFDSGDSMCCTVRVHTRVDSTVVGYRVLYVTPFAAAFTKRRMRRTTVIEVGIKANLHARPLLESDLT